MTTTAQPLMTTSQGGGFVDDLLSLGGTLVREASTTALQIYKAKQDAKLASIQDTTAQPENQRYVEPIKGQNANGQTVVAAGTQAVQTSPVLFAGITQSQVLWGSVILLVGATAAKVWLSSGD